MEAGRYQYVGTAGEGAYGNVLKCLDKNTGENVAVKALKAAHSDPQIMRLAVREVRTLQRLPQHPNVVGLRDAFRSGSGRIYVVFTLEGSSLHEEAERYPGFVLPGPLLKAVAWQLLSALAHCHAHKGFAILSGQADVAPGCCRVKLADFGFARQWEPAAGSRQAWEQAGGKGGGRQGPAGGARGAGAAAALSSYVATRWYRAPEILAAGGDCYGFNSDCWSAGCTVAELASGSPLFPGSSSIDQLWRIMRCFGPLPPQLAAGVAASPALAPLRGPLDMGRTLRERLPGVDARMYEFISACLVVDPVRRPSAAQLLQMPYFWDLPRPLLASLEVAAERLRRKDSGGRTKAAAGVGVSGGLAAAVSNAAKPRSVCDGAASADAATGPDGRAVQAAAAPMEADAAPSTPAAFTEPHAGPASTSGGGAVPTELTSPCASDVQPQLAVAVSVGQRGGACRVGSSGLTAEIATPSPALEGASAAPHRHADASASTAALGDRPAGCTPGVVPPPHSDELASAQMACQGNADPLATAPSSLAPLRVSKADDGSVSLSALSLPLCTQPSSGSAAAASPDAVQLPEARTQPAGAGAAPQVTADFAGCSAAAVVSAGCRFGPSPSPAPTPSAPQSLGACAQSGLPDTATAAAHAAHGRGHESHCAAASEAPDPGSATSPASACSQPSGAAAHETADGADDERGGLQCDALLTSARTSDATATAAGATGVTETSGMALSTTGLSSSFSAAAARESLPAGAAAVAPLGLAVASTAGFGVGLMSSTISASIWGVPSTARLPYLLTPTGVPAAAAAAQAGAGGGGGRLPHVRGPPVSSFAPQASIDSAATLQRGVVAVEDAPRAGCVGGASCEEEGGASLYSSAPTQGSMRSRSRPRPAPLPHGQTCGSERGFGRDAWEVPRLTLPGATHGAPPSASRVAAMAAAAAQTGFRSGLSPGSLMAAAAKVRRLVPQRTVTTDLGETRCTGEGGSDRPPSPRGAAGAAGAPGARGSVPGMISRQRSASRLGISQGALPRVSCGRAATAGAGANAASLPSSGPGVIADADDTDGCLSPGPASGAWNQLDTSCVQATPASEVGSRPITGSGVDRVAAEGSDGRSPEFLARWRLAGGAGARASGTAERWAQSSFRSGTTCAVLSRGCSGVQGRLDAEDGSEGDGSGGREQAAAGATGVGCVKDGVVGAATAVSAVPGEFASGQRLAVYAASALVTSYTLVAAPVPEGSEDEADTSEAAVACEEAAPAAGPGMDAVGGEARGVPGTVCSVQRAAPGGACGKRFERAGGRQGLDREAAAECCEMQVDLQRKRGSVGGWLLRLVVCGGRADAAQ